jgi:aspartate/methionine/tyrosine aminotransferase
VPAGGASIHGYGPAEGLPALRDAIKQKMADKDGLTGVSPIHAGPERAWVIGGV